MKKVGLFMLIYSIVLVASLFIVYIGNQQGEKGILNEAGEGLFNLAVNDKDVIYKHEGKVYLGFIDGNDSIKLAIHMNEKAVSIEEQIKGAKDIRELEELNAQARLQGAFILLFLSLVVSYIFYIIIAPYIFKLKRTNRKTKVRA